MFVLIKQMIRQALFLLAGSKTASALACTRNLAPPSHTLVTHRMLSQCFTLILRVIVATSSYAAAKDAAASDAAASDATANHVISDDALQVNKIRQSLRLVARNSTAFGLHQPHMERTKLCELGDEQLDRQYIQQRSSLRELVQQLAKPKRVNGKVMTGPALAELVSQMVTALNARDIPTAGSILEHFNKELVYR